MPPTTAPTDADVLASLVEHFKQASQDMQLLASKISTLKGLPANENQVSPRNWWRKQAGGFKADPTFAEFVEQVRAVRQQDL